MITRIFLLALFSGCLTSLWGQGEKGTLTPLKIQDFYFLPSLQFASTGPADLMAFDKLAPGSAILSRNYSDYVSSDYNLYANSNFQISMGLALRNSDKSEYRQNMQLQIGMSHTSALNLSQVRWREIRKPYDTLLSQQTANRLYVDSITSHYVDAQNGSDKLSLQAALVFRSNPALRWSIFGGLGVSGGLSYNSFTHIHYTMINRTALVDETGSEYFGYYPDDPDFYQEEEIFRNKSSFSGSVYLPFGVDFRMGEKSDLLKRMHIYSELRPGMDFSRIPEYGYNTRSFFQFGLGLCVSA